MAHKPASVRGTSDRAARARRRRDKRTRRDRLGREYPAKPKFAGLKKWLGKLLGR